MSRRSGYKQAELYQKMKLSSAPDEGWFFYLFYLIEILGSKISVHSCSIFLALYSLKYQHFSSHYNYALSKMTKFRRRPRPF